MPQTGTSSIQQESDYSNWKEWTDGAEQKCHASAGCGWRAAGAAPQAPVMEA